MSDVEGLGQFPRLEIGYFRTFLLMNKERNPLSMSAKRYLS